MTAQARALIRYDEQLAVVQLGPGADIPEWAGSEQALLSVTATPTETTVVCGSAAVPRKARQQGPFTAFQVRGPLDLGLTGVLAGILQPLAESDVSVFAVSTYDTDWVLVPTSKAEAAEEAWRRSGHLVLSLAEHRSAEQRSAEHRTAEHRSAEHRTAEHRTAEHRPRQSGQQP